MGGGRRGQPAPRSLHFSVAGAAAGAPAAALGPSGDPPPPAPSVAAAAKLGLGGLHGRRVQRLLIVVVEQHRDDLRLVLVARELHRQPDEAAAPLGLQRVPFPEPGLEQRGQPLAHDGGHVVVGRHRPLLELDAVPLDDLVEVERLRLAHERQRHARRPGAAGPSGPVDVVLGVLRRLVLNDVRQLGDVEPAARDVGGHQETERPGAHALEDPLAVGLRPIGAQLVGVVAEALQHHRDVVHVRLRVAEDEPPRGVLHLDDPTRARSFSIGGTV